MRHSPIIPQLSAEGFNAFCRIADWLAAGGKANVIIPFDYNWPSCLHCVGGALAYLTGGTRPRSVDGGIGQAGHVAGMSEREIHRLFSSAEARMQTPEAMAMAIREWLVSGRIVFAKTAAATFDANLTPPTLARDCVIPIPHRLREDLLVA